MNVVIFCVAAPIVINDSLLFSATLSYRVKELAFEHMNDPQLVEVEPEKMTGSRIKEELFYPSIQHKISLLLTLIEEEWPDRELFSPIQNTDARSLCLVGG